MRLSEGGFSDYPNDYFVQISAMMDNAITYCDNECVFMFSLRFELRPKKKTIKIQYCFWFPPVQQCSCRN